MENPDIVDAIVILELLAPAAQVVRALQLVLVQLQQGQALGPAYQLVGGAAVFPARVLQTAEADLELLSPRQVHTDVRAPRFPPHWPVDKCDRMPVGLHA